MNLARRATNLAQASCGRIMAITPFLPSVIWAILRAMNLLRKQSARRDVAFGTELHVMRMTMGKARVRSENRRGATGKEGNPRESSERCRLVDEYAGVLVAVAAILMALL